ncbi:PREDICTED: guanine nucleotide-binding protein subunit gamma-1-like [Priapulus caudatus]|uniref:Guanine nucleotide-binding protein subunit gamma n=1 Tax=Priapulus caudatus TaxID=37621 RepID=A0ABM1EMG6_PRICU|nr:PREDICTED: guanine nucleotide-binding protein subunit gamma-1-like [Priapulus caudatus]
MSNVANQRKLVEQLRREAGVRRQPLSACIEDLKKYCEDHRNEDVLLVGFATDKANPFKEKSSCTVL